jgi:hypothetical protein
MYQSSAAGRDAYSAARDMFTTILHLPATWADSGTENRNANETGQPGDDTADTGIRERIRKAAWPSALVIVAILIALLISAASSNGAGQFPDKSDHGWPPGVTRSAILAPAITWLAAACADVKVLSPVNCPQSVSPEDDSVSSVQWVLHGDPGDAARVVYWDGEFQVLGHAVMTVTYKTQDGDFWQMDTFGYQATVTWADGHAALASSGLQRASLDFGPAISKHDPRLPWGEVSSAVMAVFRQCAASTDTPLPVPCMNIGVGPESAKKATWELDGSPVVNAREFFDPVTGLLHVTGSYAMRESYVDSYWHTPGSLPFTDNYNATLSFDGARLTVLQISQTP